MFYINEEGILKFLLFILPITIGKLTNFINILTTNVSFLTIIVVKKKKKCYNKGEKNTQCKEVYYEKNI